MYIVPFFLFGYYMYLYLLLEKAGANKPSIWTDLNLLYRRMPVIPEMFKSHKLIFHINEALHFLFNLDLRFPHLR